MATSAFITRLRSLAPLSEADVSAVERVEMKRFTFQRRQDVLSKGMKPTFVYILLSGWAARYEARRNGSRRITGFLLPGDFCGIHAVCDASMDHSIIALNDCIVGTIQREAMGAIAKASQPIFDAVWRAKLAEEAILRKWLVYAVDAHQSVGRLLCELYARADAVGLTSDGSCEIPLTQEMIGDALGLTPVHVNRMLQKLRAEGLIELHDHELKILDAANLEMVAEFEPSYLQPWH